MKKNCRQLLILLSLTLLLLLCIINSNFVMQSILDYTQLFFKKLFPASFLFFVFSSLLIDYGLIEFFTNTLHLNGCIFYVILMSLVSGFPSGSKYTKELLDKGYIDEIDANYFITFTHFPNPLFVFGSVQSILRNQRLTGILFFSLLFGNLSLCFFHRPKKRKKIFLPPLTIKNFSRSLSSAIYQAMKVLITIYGTSVFFNLIATILVHYLSLPIVPYVVLNGFFDLTRGVFETTLISPFFVQAIFILCFISLGGLSIHMQVKSVLENSKIKYQNFFFGRIFGTIFSLFYFFLLSLFLG